ncbi:hypothetical protein BCR41DRAFT_349299 [Lobosporangium transversale]|uniref:Transmembrane protein n=1 Tax=Lobosporangium transversale TaxID=64571 RepID=A0A1Y2GUB3_9FUNG|nr:hypothetical protein BCR41DRAFT_349299 [Lobosporangium transversale]ORZ23847.1 hypothetical protein BCR41DRAFT_349299 [Lobosporangium transversale]|eukprot:XP_021883661.1 hypothetical protein BCR41DRAFT_349299 [Lobosporangium transversale]
MLPFVLSRLSLPLSFSLFFFSYLLSLTLPMCFSSLVYFHSLFLGVPFSFLFLFLLLVACRFPSLPYFLLPRFLAVYRSWGLFCFSRGGEVERWRDKEVEK